MYVTYGSTPMESGATQGIWIPSVSFTGTIDETRALNTALSPSWILTNIITRIIRRHFILSVPKVASSGSGYTPISTLGFRDLQHAGHARGHS